MKNIAIRQDRKKFSIYMIYEYTKAKLNNRYVIKSNKDNYHTE